MSTAVHRPRQQASAAPEDASGRGKASDAARSTRARLERGDYETVARDIHDRFPKVMAALAE